MAGLTICAISGSLRAGSFNPAALRAAAELAPRGVEVVAQSIADIPLYNEDLGGAGFPAAVLRLRDAIASADAVLIATPEYNYSVPGALGIGRAQHDPRKMFVYLDAHPLNGPEIMISAAPARFDADGKLTDDATRKLVAQLVAAPRDWTERLRSRC